MLASRVDRVQLSPAVSTVKALALLEPTTSISPIIAIPIPFSFPIAITLAFAGHSLPFSLTITITLTLTIPSPLPLSNEIRRSVLSDTRHALGLTRGCGLEHTHGLLARELISRVLRVVFVSFTTTAFFLAFPSFAFFEQRRVAPRFADLFRFLGEFLDLVFGQHA